MSKFIARAKVVLTALPTRLIALAAIVTFAAPLAANALPEYAAGIVRWSATVVALLGAAVQIIRKVTPVLPDQVGILPQGPPASPVVVIDQTPPVDHPDDAFGDVPTNQPNGGNPT